MIRPTIALSFFLGAVTPALCADLWPGFRGPKGTASSPTTGLPAKWSDTENMRWKADLPGRGIACPVIADKKLFLTASSGMADTRLHALCFDTETGKKLWERQFWATGQTICHPDTCMACPTPVTDGKTVYCVYASGDVVALNTNGDVLWIRSLCRDYPGMVNFAGRSSSPVLHGDTLVILMENQGESYLLGLDTANGKNKWKIARQLECNWNTPLIFERDGRADLLVASSEGLAAFDPQTGQQKWHFDSEKFHPIISPLPGGGDTVVAAGRGLVVLKLGSNAGPEVVWKSPKIGSGFSTPVVAGGRIYGFGAGQAVLLCMNAADGKVLWEQRLKGPYSASPVVADGKLFVVNEAGDCSVFRLGDKAEELGKSALKERIQATPAIADGAIFIRSDKHLYCIGGSNKKS